MTVRDLDGVLYMNRHAIRFIEEDGKVTEASYKAYADFDDYIIIRIDTRIDYEPSNLGAGSGRIEAGLDVYITNK